MKDETSGSLAFGDRDKAMDWVEYQASLTGNEWEKVEKNHYEICWSSDDRAIAHGTVRAVRISNPAVLLHETDCPPKNRGDKR
ncbi:hypothetical protein HTZ84_04960 [Haloterrigena sp. SYSU A558-1]|uniref:Uncharacterized protein n=1 Tax=Haloterrigena gelatinilytica TaxID=2741724 RepID=A0ABX2L7F7_9EURY|nr:hypothetical protein [Haloterrigena gelatinilytica]NUC71666.1 hypothetical protein [Haloterrigena gelatinilytica]